ncbi:hypothetical protein L6164_000500 [Bauhinia variegata]|uniref:Uncharacterized protein n=1 Tax=Bauhinia variegata TaxID=167791 RepID=A0ACB9Q6Z0_BAUVA|nr:hypothetical protein L6164_000500 [Bauhinia variegata]
MQFLMTEGYSSIQIVNSYACGFNTLAPATCWPWLNSSESNLAAASISFFCSMLALYEAGGLVYVNIIIL